MQHDNRTTEELIAELATARQRVADTEAALHRRDAILAALQQVGWEITAELGLDEVLHSIVSQALELLGGTDGGLYLYRHEQEAMELAVVTGSNAPTVGTVISRNEDNIPGRVWETGEPIVVGDSQHPAPRRAEWAGYPSSPLIGVPIHQGAVDAPGVLLGVLIVRREVAQPFALIDVRLLEMFATQIAIVISKAQLFESERAQREMAQALEAAAAAVSSTLEIDQVLDRILEQVERVVPGDAFNVMLVHEDTVETVRWRGYERLGVKSPSTYSPFPIGDMPSLVRMMDMYEPVVISDTASDSEWVPLEDRAWLRSYVGAPIRVGEVTVGFLNMNGTSPGRFGPVEASRLHAFANHVAAALENARLYEELRAHAAQLEQRVDERTFQLRTHVAQLDAILRSTTDGIIVTNSQGEIIQSNPIAESWLDRTLSPNDAARLQKAVKDLTWLVDERPEEVLELAGMDIELVVSPIVEPEARDDRTVIVVHDISHLKAVDRMKTRFISNVSHELRTPITTIRLYAELMQRNPGKWKEYLAVLIQESDRQANLVADILQISEIDAGRIELSPWPISLNELVENASSQRQAMARESGVRLSHRLAKPAPIAVVDPNRIRQVLNDLIVNGIQYTPEGGMVIVSTGVAEEAGRTWATLVVEDTGIGIPTADLPHVFERFFRGEGQRQIQIAGTGLGLAIVKEIVEMHGGQVMVESEVSVGTTFTVWLPLAA